MLQNSKCERWLWNAVHVQQGKTANATVHSQACYERKRPVVHAALHQLVKQNSLMLLPLRGSRRWQ